MKKPEVIRQFDYIRIVNPRPIIRVGYKLHPSQFVEEIKKDEKIIAALESIGVCCGGPRSTTLNWYKFSLDIEKEVPFKLAYALAYERVAREGFGGNVRSLHYREGDFEFLRGKVFHVHDKVIRKTGTRFPSSGGYDSYSGEYDYESGGLSDEKTHILFSVYHEANAAKTEDGLIGISHYVDSYFERCDVEKVTEYDWYKCRYG